ncbi:MAG: hypothetical protein HQM16_03570 [Deltaproteobacteria bacterium]|nr:hypothetical protein [Deltaproteobacteria bacterium]
MKKWIVLIIIFFALISVACKKNESIFMEDTKKNPDHVFQKTDDKTNQGLDQVGEIIQDDLSKVDEIMKDKSL